MKRLKNIGVMVCGLLMLGGISSQMSSAQDSGVSGDLQRTATATPAERLQYAVDAIEEVNATLEEAQKLLQQVQREGDSQKVECLAKRVADLRTLAKVTELAEASMRIAIEAGNQERAGHEMRKIAVAISKARQLSLEAQACIEEAGVAAGETVVRAEGGLDSDEDETEPLSTDVLNQGYDPPDASPYN